MKHSHCQGPTSPLLGPSERQRRDRQIRVTDEEREPHQRPQDEQRWHQAQNPHSSCFLLQGPPPVAYTLHTRLCRGPQDTGSKHASRHPETLAAELQAPRTGATRGHSDPGAAWEDGGPRGTGVISQDCLAAPTLGGKVPEDTQHTDLKPKNGHDPLGQKQHSSHLIPTSEA